MQLPSLLTECRVHVADANPHSAIVDLRRHPEARRLRIVFELLEVGAVCLGSIENLLDLGANVVELSHYVCPFFSGGFALGSPPRSSWSDEESECMRWCGSAIAVPSEQRLGVVQARSAGPETKAR